MHRLQVRKTRTDDHTLHPPGMTVHMYPSKHTMSLNIELLRTTTPSTRMPACMYPCEPHVALEREREKLR